MSPASFDSPPQAAAALSMMPFIDPILHGVFSQVNGTFLPSDHTLFMKAIWDRVQKELSAREDAKGREVAWLAEKLGGSVQRVNNWKARGVPPSAHAAVAKALGWSIDALLGKTVAPASEWPLAPYISQDEWTALDAGTRGALAWETFQALQRIRQAVPAPGNVKPKRAA